MARRKQRYSAAWFWQGALLLLAIGAFIGGVDHGFFQVAGDTSVRKMVQHTTWFVIGLLTFATFLTVVEQFLDARWRRIAYTVAGLQLALYLAAIPLVDTYGVVIAGYLPVMSWSLVLQRSGPARRHGHVAHDSRNCGGAGGLRDSGVRAPPVRVRQSQRPVSRRHGGGRVAVLSRRTAVEGTCEPGGTGMVD